MFGENKLIEQIKKATLKIKKKNKVYVIHGHG